MKKAVEKRQKTGIKTHIQKRTKKRIKSVQNNEVGEKKVKKDKKELTKREESDRIYARLRERYRESREDEERGNKNLKKLEKTS